MSRNFLPKANMLGEDRIAFRPFNHLQKAEIREPSAIVHYNGVYYFPIAACHEFVRHHNWNGTAFGDREKVGLALGSDTGNQRLVIKPLGVLKDRTRDINRIIRSEDHDYVERSIAGMGQLLCELSPGSPFNFVR